MKSLPDVVARTTESQRLARSHWSCRGALREIVATARPRNGVSSGGGSSGWSKTRADDSKGSELIILAIGQWTKSRTSAGAEW